MKLSILLAAGLCFAGVANAGSTMTNNNVWVALSPNLVPSQLQAFINEEFAWLLKAPADTRVRCIDAATLKDICDMHIPAVENEKGRSKALQAEAQKLIAWARGSMERSDKSGRLDLPGVMRVISPDVTPTTSVLIVGSPLYQSDEAGFNFYDPSQTNMAARFRRPAHSHLVVTPMESPFGTRGIENELGTGGVQVYWLLPDEEAGSTIYQLELRNFWAQYVSKINGALVSWSTDTERTLDNLLTPYLAPIPSQFHEDETNFLMISMERPTGGSIIVTNAPPVIQMKRVTMNSITDFIIVDRTASMSMRMSNVVSMVLNLPEGPSKNYALIFFDDHDISAVPAVLACEGCSLASIAQRIETEPLKSGTTVPEALEDAIALVREIIHKRGLKKTNLYIFTDAPANKDCPYGFDYRQEVTQLIGEGHSIIIADIGAPFYNAIVGTIIKSNWQPNSRNPNL